MASGRIRSTRRLRNWMVEQVSSGNYPGLIWDDEAKTMFRIPWKHASKQDFRSNEDAAIFKAWAEFKGKLSEGGRSDPASWKTRMRCALNKSPEFKEVTDRSQLDISEPYKVYRLVPANEQTLSCGSGNIKSRERPGRRKRRRSSESDSEEDEPEAKQMKEEAVAPVPISMFVQDIEAAGEEATFQSEELVQPVVAMKNDGTVDEIQLNVTIETVPSCGAEHSFEVSVCYLGKEVLHRVVMGSDVRIAYPPSSSTPPTPPALMLGGFPRILFPEPSSPDAGSLQALSTLLPYMEKGVMLTSTGSGVYAKRFCRGRVYWTGPHSSTPGPLKMERAMEPVMLFSKDVFKQELENFRFSAGAPTPQCGVTLCFGEELLDSEDPSSKLIISRVQTTQLFPDLIRVNITFPWAQQQIQEASAFKESMAILHDLATQSPHGEVTINLVPVPLGDELQMSGSTLL